MIFPHPSQIEFGMKVASKAVLWKGNYESISDRILRGPLRGIKSFFYYIIEDLPRG
jgi:hypothetical protein